MMGGGMMPYGGVSAVSPLSFSLLDPAFVVWKALSIHSRSDSGMVRINRAVALPRTYAANQVGQSAHSSGDQWSKKWNRRTIRELVGSGVDDGSHVHGSI
jgi:hypothetical protein